MQNKICRKHSCFVINRHNNIRSKSKTKTGVRLDATRTVDHCTLHAQPQHLLFLMSRRSSSTCIARTNTEEDGGRRQTGVQDFGEFGFSFTQSSILLAFHILRFVLLLMVTMMILNGHRKRLSLVFEWTPSFSACLEAVFLLSASSSISSCCRVKCFAFMRL